MFDDIVRMNSSEEFEFDFDLDDDLLAESFFSLSIEETEIPSMKSSL